MEGYTKVKYTGKKPTSSLIDKSGSVEWKKGNVKFVMNSKVNNHVKYPYFELASNTKPAKTVRTVETPEVVELVEEVETPEVVELTPEEEIKLADAEINN